MQISMPEPTEAKVDLSLNVAVNILSANHPVSKFLMDNGALNIEPEL
jgi:hypothetical protein